MSRGDGGRPLLPSKVDVARYLLARGSVFVHLDATATGVVVPEEHRGERRLVLQVGRGLPVPIPDLRVTQAGMAGTLSFSGRPFECRLSWRAVFAMCGEDGRGLVWPESMPEGLAEELEEEVERLPPMLRVVRSDEARLESAARVVRLQGGVDVGASPPRLRVVKEEPARVTRMERAPAGDAVGAVEREQWLVHYGGKMESLVEDLQEMLEDGWSLVESLKNLSAGLSELAWEVERDVEAAGKRESDG